MTILLTTLTAAAADPLRLTAPLVRPTLVARYPHDKEASTQGLAFCDSETLWESTGLEGRSSLRQVQIKDGTPLKTRSFTPTIFAEGLTRSGEDLVLLTYKNRQVFRCPEGDLENGRWQPYNSEGWGLTESPYDGLIASDGSSNLIFLDDDLNESRRLEVKDEDQPIFNLNELEFCQSKLLANVLTTNLVAVISLQSGQVELWLDLGHLLSPEESAQAGPLNGIAYNPDNGHLFFTGKNWPWLFEMKLNSRKL
ncbi:glutaminyl-peptide cyclotransferase [bacterium]|nr:glutaminyl-peptide cyclotransferase [bacterium]